MTSNTTLAENLRRKLEAMAGPGKSADDLANQILSQYCSRQDAANDLEALSRWGQEQSRRMGHKTSAVMAAITEPRKERRGR